MESTITFIHSTMSIVLTAKECMLCRSSFTLVLPFSKIWYHFDHGPWFCILTNNPQQFNNPVFNTNYIFFQQNLDSGIHFNVRHTCVSIIVWLFWKYEDSVVIKADYFIFFSTGTRFGCNLLFNLPLCIMILDMWSSL